MSEIEDRQYSSDGALEFEKLIENYSPLNLPPISDNNPYEIGSSDLMYQDEIAKAKSTPGNVYDESKVISTYDARPINAIDFVLSLTNTLNLSLGRRCTFTVPPGIVAILKWFSFFIVSPSTLNATISVLGFEVAPPSSINLSITLNGVPQPNYSNLMLGSYVKRLPCYIIAPENSVINFDFIDPDTFDGSIMNVLLRVYGQHLISSGRPANFEPGNTPPKPPIKQINVDSNNYDRYVRILNEGKRLNLVNPSLDIPTYAAYKAAETQIWKINMPAILKAIKNLTGKDI